MLQESTVVHSEPADRSTTHVVHALMQFLLAVRYRKNLVFISVVVAGLLGGLYYFTATPYYGANASLLVLRSDSTRIVPTMTTEGARQRNLMPTFVKLFTSTKVVQGALQHLRPEDCIDFAGTPQEAWPAIIKVHLSAEAVLRTNIIEASYRSKDPKAAVAVLNAVVRSYRDFLLETHRGTSAAAIQVLTNKLQETQDEINRKEEEELRLRDEIGDMTSHSTAEAMHPTLKSVLYLREKLDETQIERMELEASLATISDAIRKGEDLQQQVMAVAKVVGEELLLNTLGIDRHHAYMQAETRRILREDQARLTSMSEHFGPTHPKWTALAEKIRMTKYDLAMYHQQVSEELARLQSEVLGPKLEQMIQHRLGEIWQKEAALQVKFNQAEAEAIHFNGQLARLERIQHRLDWLDKSHENLLSQISSTYLKHDGQEVRAEPVHDPVVATKPVSPNLRQVILMTLMGGLGVGLALVYVLDILDDRFRSVEEMQAQLKLPVLAMVRQLEDTATTGIEALPVHTAPNCVESEAFRTLRTGLALADQQARQIVVSSAEPGDGKTTVLANLAVSLAQSDKRTLLIDADLRRPGLTALMGMRGIAGLSGIVRGTGDVVKTAAAGIRPSGIEGLDVLPAGPRPTNPAELLAHPRFSELLAWAEAVYDQVLIDSPPALATSDAAVIGRLVDGVVMVVQPGKNRRRMVIRATESLAALKIPLLGIVVNRVGAENDRGYYGYGGGYGYGYGYSYGPDDEQQDSMDELAGEEEDLHDMNLTDRSYREEADFHAGIVPRRVT